MLKQQTGLFNRLAVAGDILILFAALGLAYLLRQPFAGEIRDFIHYLWILIVAIPVWFFLLTRYELYSSIRRLSLFDIFSRIVNVHFLGGLTCAAFIFFFDREVFSRAIYGGFVFFSFLLITVERLGIRILLGILRRRGYNTRHLIIVGTREKARRFYQIMEEHADWGLQIIGFVQALPGTLQEEIAGYPVLGRVEDLIDICKRHQVDEIVFCLPKNLFIDAETYVRELEEMGITVRMLLDFFDVYTSRRQLDLFHNEIPILTFHTKTLDAQQLFLKRVLDICGALVGLGITTVLFPFVAFAIKRDSPGPVLFSQLRVGENGRTFRCWKFRSMYIDAEARKKDLLAQNEMSGAIFKMKNDPRITPVGHFLRKTSIDELPQFWNVLKGEMSLVGTRPPTPDEVAQYENWHRRRISIKPGITGKWQISGRNRIEDFDAIVRLDLDYIDSWNLWLDIKILLRTLVVVFRREGSC